MKCTQYIFKENCSENSIVQNIVQLGISLCHKSATHFSCYQSDDVGNCHFLLREYITGLLKIMFQ